MQMQKALRVYVRDSGPLRNVAAHLNALVARNYAAHHDYLDDDLVGGTRVATQPHPGAALMSSCLLVVIAALHSLPPPSSSSAAAQP